MPNFGAAIARPTSAPALSADWVTGADNPRLRGAF